MEQGTVETGRTIADWLEILLQGTLGPTIAVVGVYAMYRRTRRDALADSRREAGVGAALDVITAAGAARLKLAETAGPDRYVKTMQQVSDLSQALMFLVARESRSPDFIQWLTDVAGLLMRAHTDERWSDLRELVDDVTFGAQTWVALDRDERRTIAALLEEGGVTFRPGDTVTWSTDCGDGQSDVQGEEVPGGPRDDADTDK